MQVTENTKCEKHDLVAGGGQGWIYVRVGGAKNPPVFRAEGRSRDEDPAWPESTAGPQSAFQKVKDSEQKIGYGRSVTKTLGAYWARFLNGGLLHNKHFRHTAQSHNG
mgnify:CR=1 FL=1